MGAMMSRPLWRKVRELSAGLAGKVADLPDGCPYPTDAMLEEIRERGGELGESRLGMLIAKGEATPQKSGRWRYWPDAEVERVVEACERHGFLSDKAIACRHLGLNQAYSRNKIS